MEKRIDKSYTDFISEMYYDPSIALKPNESLTRNVTFQVTDSCDLNCKYCLTGDTEVLMADLTTKPIKDVVIGDKVLGVEEYRNGSTKECLYEATVLNKFEREAETLNITCENGNSINITPNHRVLNDRSGTNDDWKKAGELTAGQSMFYADENCDIQKTAITCILANEGTDKVYNIETTTRTYVANGFVVHNCYQQNKGKRFMSKETARKAADLLFKMYYNDDGEFINKKTKAIVLDFIGGEPLLAIDIIDYVCTYFVKKCLELNHPWLYTWRASMTTNGTHYFSDGVQNFLKKFGDNVSFSITIDGPKEIHDSCRVHKDGRGNFDEAYAALKHYNANYKSELGTKVTIAPENLKEINRIVNFFIGEGIKIIHANCVFEEKWNLEQAQIFYKELKLMADTLLKLNDETTVSLFTEKHFGPLPETENKPYCGGAGKMLAFDPDGKAYPCVRYMESSLGKEIEPLVIGSVDGLFVRKEEQNIKLMLDSIDRRTESDDKCYYCPIASGCSYCVAYNYQSGGLPIRRNKNICLMHKARSLANVYYWNKWYKQNNIKSTFYMHLPKEDAVEIIGKDEYNMLVELSK